MEIHCHKCDAHKTIKKENYKKGNIEVYCYCDNPSVPTWMSFESRQESEKSFNNIIGKFKIA